MANFTTADKVRSESGFNNNPNISDTTINSYIDRANGVVLSFVGPRYLITTLVSSTDFTGSQAEKFLIGVETRLASAYLLQQEYGEEGTGTKDGYAKEEQAEFDLERIMKGEILLLKNDGSEIDRAAAKQDPTQNIGNGLAGYTGEKFFSVNQDF